MLGVVDAFKVLGRRLPDLVRETTTTLQSGRSAVDAETLAARICVVAAQAVVAYRACEDQISSELKFYRSELKGAGQHAAGGQGGASLRDQESDEHLQVGSG
ncbi:hypothetical protein [Sphingomonas sp.]|uniref:hypothetical protein n=1 Tax=Sphingomonas sp. TaxID=28214 RepID=UPI003B000469